MIAVRVLVFALGAAVTAVAFFSAVRIVVLPRAATDPIGRAVFRSSYAAFRVVLKTRKTYEARERLAAFYGPVSLLLLPAAWLSVVLLGYMAMFWAIGVDGWRDAFFTSGSSMLTLGFA